VGSASAIGIACLPPLSSAAGWRFVLLKQPARTLLIVHPSKPAF